MEQSCFSSQIESWKTLGLDTVGDYVVIRTPHHLDWWSRSHYMPIESFKHIEYPFLISLVEGEENMCFIPLTRKDVLEMLSAML